jgi:hypothetical protein
MTCACTLTAVLRLCVEALLVCADGVSPQLTLCAAEPKSWSHTLEKLQKHQQSAASKVLCIEIASGMALHAPCAGPRLPAVFAGTQRVLVLGGSRAAGRGGCGVVQCTPARSVRPPQLLCGGRCTRREPSQLIVRAAAASGAAADLPSAIAAFPPSERSGKLSSDIEVAASTSSLLHADANHGHA